MNAEFRSHTEKIISFMAIKEDHVRHQSSIMDNSAYEKFLISFSELVQSKITSDNKFYTFFVLNFSLAETSHNNFEKIGFEILILHLCGITNLKTPIYVYNFELNFEIFEIVIFRTYRDILK
ncbi:hypothetical protein BpHYR1_038365 [Brachionus plicatilis]|uniref:Uncharacterized protein n=1 Tax=Brachionus plicatilis TaxID=10195 RepID=A0A3M7R2A6_BRAPC|nr:hypothetical protein BpHYR1_038365 [Brachionus plicatilis]